MEACGETERERERQRLAAEKAKRDAEEAERQRELNEKRKAELDKQQAEEEKRKVEEERKRRLVEDEKKKVRAQGSRSSLSHESDTMGSRHGSSVDLVQDGGDGETPQTPTKSDRVAQLKGRMKARKEQSGDDTPSEPEQTVTDGTGGGGEKKSKWGLIRSASKKNILPLLRGEMEQLKQAGVPVDSPAKEPKKVSGWDKVLPGANVKLLRQRLESQSSLTSLVGDSVPKSNDSLPRSGSISKDIKQASEPNPPSLSTSPAPKPVTKPVETAGQSAAAMTIRKLAPRPTVSTSSPTKSDVSSPKTALQSTSSVKSLAQAKTSPSEHKATLPPRPSTKTEPAAVVVKPKVELTSPDDGTTTPLNLSGSLNLSGPASPASESPRDKSKLEEMKERMKQTRQRRMSVLPNQQ